jgi:hypothetical protein
MRLRLAAALVLAPPQIRIGSARERKIRRISGPTQYTANAT